MVNDVKEDKSTEHFCPNCSGALVFNPQTQSLSCIYCGSNINIDGKNANARNTFDYWEYINNSNYESDYSKSTHIIKCESCGGQTVLPVGELSTACSFCGSTYIVDIGKLNCIQPQYLVPFKFDQRKAIEKSNKWRSKLLFAPKNFKKPISMEENHAIYIPFWNYDADTFSKYKAQRGDRIVVTHTQKVNGKNQTVTTTKMVWRPVSGTFDYHFLDILILGSHKNNQKIIRKIDSFNQTEMVEYNEKYLAGFAAEHYYVSLEQGFVQAKARMNDMLASFIRNQIGGDEVRFLKISTDYSDIRFKLTLFPIYIFVGRYGKRNYQFGVNGQTGKSAGQYPISAWKVLIAIFLPVIGILILLFLAQDGK